MFKPGVTGWLALTGALVLGCGGGGDEGAAAGGDGGAEPEAQAAPVVDPAVAATIAGTATFEGAAPTQAPIDMSEEPVCNDKYTSGPPLGQTVQVADGRLANVFVYVKEGLGDLSFPVPGTSVVIDQDGCRYHPHVLGIQAGQTLLIRNQDAVLHNINTQPTMNRSFNVSQPQADMESHKKFRSPEVMIPVKCDVHGWMNAFIGVLDHPYYSVSASDGSFSLDGLPPGDYVIEAWHELYGTQTQNVTVGPQESAEITFMFSNSMASADTEVPLGEPLMVSAHAGAAHENPVVRQ